MIVPVTGVLCDVTVSCVALLVPVVLDAADGRVSTLFSCTRLCVACTTGTPRARSAGVSGESSDGNGTRDVAVCVCVTCVTGCIGVNKGVSCACCEGAYVGFICVRKSDERGEMDVDAASGEANAGAMDVVDVDVVLDMV